MLITRIKFNIVLPFNHNDEFNILAEIIFNVARLFIVFQIHAAQDEKLEIYMCFLWAVKT